LAWTTSWGVSTRLIGGLLMTHSDDNGLVLPPRLSPLHVVILPVIHKDTAREEVMTYCRNLADELKQQHYDHAPVRVEIDERDVRGGEKTWQWVKKGVPVRLEIGPRDIAQDAVFVGRRDREARDRNSMPRAEFVATVAQQLREIQDGLFHKALAFREAHSRRIDSRDELYDFFTADNEEKPEIHGGFAWCHWSGDPAVEEQIKNDLNVTIRCIPLDTEEESGQCIITGKPSKKRVVLAKSY
jgi:prolyl-tRNA synthetase